MENQTSFVVTEWLSLDQVLTLLRTGELSSSSSKGTLRLYLNFPDRVAAQELAKKK